MSYKGFFHYLSYLQYPFMAVSFYYYFLFVFSFKSGEGAWLQINTMLILMGVAISFSTLQDTSKVQNKLSRKVWQSPKKGKAFIYSLSLIILLTISAGLYFYFNTAISALKEVSIGLIVLSIGLIGLLKTAIEMFEKHRSDKKLS
ncbi:MAG: hypothetical protein ACPGLV_15805 [Bacteroidia bacterium]